MARTCGIFQILPVQVNQDCEEKYFLTGLENYVAHFCHFSPASFFCKCFSNLFTDFSSTPIFLKHVSPTRKIFSSVFPIKINFFILINNNFLVLFWRLRIFHINFRLNIFLPTPIFYACFLSRITSRLKIFSLTSIYLQSVFRSRIFSLMSSLNNFSI